MLELKRGPCSEPKDATRQADNHPRFHGVPQFREISPKVVSIKVSINVIRGG